ncbi:MAG: hypothetical protein N3A58_02940 [Spirochaetes bacterium]|nr:hypothetical protein [Spirochaetota bacterium]
MKNFLKNSFILLILFSLAIISSSCSLFYPYIGIWENSGSSLGNNYTVTVTYGMKSYTLEVKKNNVLNSGSKGTIDLKGSGSTFEGPQYQEKSYENGQWITKYQTDEIKIVIENRNKMYIYYKYNNDWVNWFQLFGIEYLIKK